MMNFTTDTANSRPSHWYSNKVGKPDSILSSHAPSNAANTAGAPKRQTTEQSAFLPTKANLNKLFAKCTMAVTAIATSTGKNKATTGMSKVPKPNPEKKVKQDARKAANDTQNSSI